MVFEITGALSAGHARALLGLSDSSEIEKLAARIVAEGLSVRATEEIISTGAPKRKGAKKLKATKSASPELQEIADTMGDSLDTRVSIQGRRNPSINTLNRVLDVLGLILSVQIKSMN